ncbi:type IV pilin N-terminal domain-containing protein [Methanosarcina hadiensis]|uniref:type IV pilin N-terminal domain-containing protein n=1 Tax=Methanosarcina hadiensis TaxID=3078083 RepID=UPI0039777DAC
MEGKKYRALGQDCKAVSEVMGAVLMISVVVLAFSAVAITVFSDGEAVDPPHTPHTNLRENINTSEDTVEIFHNGGEEIDFENIRIILRTGGKQAEFNMSESAVKIFDPKGNQLSSDGVFELGNRIVIDPTSKINITSGNAVDLYFVHTASDQVIQKTTLWRDVRDLPYWITPHTFPAGTAYDNYTKTWLDTELVDKDDDESTNSFIPQKEVICENFTFGINIEELGIPESALFSNVTLKIISTRHDNSAKEMELKIYNGSQWTSLGLISFKGKDEYVVTQCNITKYVKTPIELKNFEVEISADGHASDNSGKYFMIDFVGVHVEY